MILNVLMTLMFLFPQRSADKELVFFPSLGTMNEPGVWTARIHGWVFEPENDSPFRRAFIAGLEQSLGDMTAQERALFRERMRWFLVDNERGERIHVQVGDERLAMNLSDASGHFHGLVTFPGPPEPAKHFFHGLLDKKDRRRFDGRIHCIADGGWAVISDLDDTIKISGVLDKKTLLANTFCRPFQEVPGLAEIYTGWAKNGASFHYISASPWQLYPALETFLHDAGFPEGLFVLRSFRLKDRSLVDFLFEDKVAYKREHILQLYRRFPRKKFLLIGDSGEKDPEVYATVAKQFPERTLGILIRQVRSHPDEARLRTLAAQVGPVRFHSFREASEISKVQLRD